MAKKLTKKQEKILHTALCVDDLLYQKYQHLMGEVYRAHSRLISEPGRIHSVIGIRGDTYLRLAVKEVEVTPVGTRSTVVL